MKRLVLLLLGLWAVAVKSSDTRYQKRYLNKYYGESGSGSGSGPTQGGKGFDNQNRGKGTRQPKGTKSPSDSKATKQPTPPKGGKMAKNGKGMNAPKGGSKKGKKGQNIEAIPLADFIAIYENGTLDKKDVKRLQDVLEHSMEEYLGNLFPEILSVVLDVISVQSENARRRLASTQVQFQGYVTVAEEDAASIDEQQLQAAQVDFLMSADAVGLGDFIFIINSSAPATASPTSSIAPTSSAPPTVAPTSFETPIPTPVPTEGQSPPSTPSPSKAPTTKRPTAVPSTRPSAQPVVTDSPTGSPLAPPTRLPSLAPSDTPSATPSTAKK